MRSVPRLLALLLSAACLLNGIYTMGNINLANISSEYHYTFAMGDFWPGVTPQYTHMLQYLLPWAKHSIGAFSVTMYALNVLEFALVFDVLNRVTRSPWAALALFVPVLAITMHVTTEPGMLPDTTLPIHHPLRTLTVWLVIWLVSRESRWALPVSLLAAANNLDFGLPVLIAAAIGDWRVHGRWRVSAVCAALLPFVLPSLTKQMEYAHYGFGMIPMPDLGVHWIVFATFVAACVVGWRDRRSVTLMLGLFGLAASFYYVGRSHPSSLLIVLGFWGPCVAVMLWERIDRLDLSTVILAALFSLCVVDVASLPVPDLARLTAHEPLFPGAVQAMADRVRIAGVSPVLISYPYGKLIAKTAGVEDIAPFAVGGEIHTDWEANRVLEQTAKVQAVFGVVPPQVEDAMGKQGFKLMGRAQVPGGIYCFASEWSEWRRE